MGTRTRQYRSGGSGKKIPTKSKSVEEWERTGRISRNQAERLASSTHTPFGYLFMKKPIREDMPIADFRTRGVGVLLFEVPQVDRSHAARYRYITPPRYCSTANETAHVAVLIWRI